MAKWIIASVVLLSGCIPQEHTIAYSPDCSGRAMGAGDVREAPPAAFLFAGQSNMSGLGEGDGTRLENVVVWMHDHWETYDPKGCFGPERGVMEAWSNTNPTAVMGFVKVAYGDTSLEGDWHPYYDPARARHPEYGPLYRRLVDVYRSMNVPSAGVFWHQGEADSMYHGTAYNYYNNLQTFIGQLRGETGTVPFVLAQTGSPADYLDMVNQAQRDITALPLVCSVPTADLSTWETIHLDTAGQLAVGDRFYEAFVRCLPD